MEKKEGKEKGWLSKEFGVSYSKLDEDTREFVDEIGENGVRELVKEAEKRKLYRGERITGEEATRLIQNVSRLADEGGGTWAPGEKQIGGDKPSDWIMEELEYLMDLGEE